MEGVGRLQERPLRRGDAFETVVDQELQDRRAPMLLGPCRDPDQMEQN